MTRLRWIVPLFVAGCDASGRQEAQTVATAVERFRQADNAGKPAAVSALRDARCSEPAVCAARDACLAFANPTEEALRAKSDVELALGRLEKGELAKDSPEAAGLAAKLEHAERLLREGQSKLTGCDDAVLAMRRRYRL